MTAECNLFYARPLAARRAALASAAAALRARSLALRGAFLARVVFWSASLWSSRSRRRPIVSPFLFSNKNESENILAFVCFGKSLIIICHDLVTKTDRENDWNMIDPAEQPKIIEIADGFCVRQEIDNITWIDLGDGGLVVDALEHPEKRDEVFEAIVATLGDKPVKYLLNTHTHYDHVALNDAFQQRWGTKIIHAKNTCIPKEGIWLEGPTRCVQFLPMPGCHTAEDCVAWVPSERVLLVGDIFGWGLIPLITNMRDEHVRTLIATYRRLIDFEPEVVIPGHGPLATVEHLKRWVEYFRWLVSSVCELVTAGKEESQILEALPVPQDMRDWWRLVLWKHEDNLRRTIKPVQRDWVHVNSVD